MIWRRRLRSADRGLGWRIAVLFMVGSFLFALGSFPLYAQNIDPGMVGVTFFGTPAGGPATMSTESTTGRAAIGVSIAVLLWGLPRVHAIA